MFGVGIWVLLSVGVVVVFVIFVGVLLSVGVVVGVVVVFILVGSVLFGSV